MYVREGIQKFAVFPQLTRLYQEFPEMEDVIFQQDGTLVISCAADSNKKTCIAQYWHVLNREFCLTPPSLC